MKIHDKEALVMTILDVVAITLAIWYMVKREVDVCSVAVLLYACLGLKTNITAVFSEEASIKRKKQIANLKKAYRNVFGRFAPLAPFSFIIFLGVGVLLLKILEFLSKSAIEKGRLRVLFGHKIEINCPL